MSENENKPPDDAQIGPMELRHYEEVYNRGPAVHLSADWGHPVTLTLKMSAGDCLKAAAWFTLYAEYLARRQREPHLYRIRNGEWLADDHAMRVGDLIFCEHQHGQPTEYWAVGTAWVWGSASYRIAAVESAGIRLEPTCLYLGEFAS